MFRRAASPPPMSSRPSKLHAAKEDRENLDIELSNTVHEASAPVEASGWTIMGLQPSAEITAIGMVYFSQGILKLSKLGMAFFLKDTLHLSPAQAALFVTIEDIPWLIKPLYGFVSDAIPFFGYRRRSYLIACGLLGASSWFFLSTSAEGTVETGAGVVFAALSMAFSDVVVDSIVVEKTRGAPSSQAGSLQSLCWASHAAGGICASYFGGSLVELYGPRFVFGLTAFFPLLILASALLIDEKPNKAADANTGNLPQRFVALGTGLWKSVTQKEILYPIIFIFLWQATPSPSSAMFYFNTEELGFTPEFLGRVSLAASVSSLAAIIVYNTFLKKLEIRTLLFWSMIIGVGLNSLTLVLVSRANLALGISDRLFTLGDNVVLTALGRVSMMPILVLATKICPPGLEATLFATLMSISNAGAATSGLLGGWLTSQLGVNSDNFDHLFLLVSLCTIAVLIPAPFLQLLPKGMDGEEKVDQEESKERLLAAEEPSRSRDKDRDAD
jgi:folate/biopterin transporter